MIFKNKISDLLLWVLIYEASGYPIYLESCFRTSWPFQRGFLDIKDSLKHAISYRSSLGIQAQYKANKKGWKLIFWKKSPIGKNEDAHLNSLVKNVQDDACKGLLGRGKHMDDIWNLFLSNKKCNLKLMP